MLNRRHLRIKVLHALYAFFQSEDRDLPKAERQLIHSVEKFFELYIHLLAILQRLHGLQMDKLALRRKRIMATEEDRNPSTRFVDNPILLELVNNKALNEAIERYKIQWDEDRMDLVRDVHNRMMQGEDYEGYMSLESTTAEDDMRVVVQIFKKCVVNSDLIQHNFDEMSIFWSDDLDLAASMGIKTLKGYKGVETGTGKLLELFKDEKEEKEFVKELFRRSVLLADEHEKIIDEKTENWDLERIAFMDILLMKMALAEARTFKFIPTKVTLNEYIELSKYYSTPKSKTFINGILDKIFISMKEEGLIKKMGRGLLES